MKALEFQSALGPGKLLAVPPEVAQQLPAGQPVRVLLLVEEPDEDREWARMAAEEFVKGYADSNAIYAQLSPG